MEARTRSAAESLARWATAGMLLVLLVAYRRVGALILSALPLASAAVAGLAAVSALFGSVHGITLAFGFTLLGVAQDYPLHLLSHRRPGVEPERVAAGLWPTLATGIASTCVAYLTFWFSGVTGLQQLACFTVTGLAVAGLTARYVLPRVMTQGPRDYGQSPVLARLGRAIGTLPRPMWAAAALVAACAGAITLAPQPFWENDLSALTPVPADLLERDRALRAELGVADTRHLLVVEAATADAALEALEALDPELEQAVAAGAIATYDHAARYVPSSALQLARAAQLPDAATLRAELETALLRAPFRPTALEPFLADVERARTLPPLTFAQARAVPVFGSRLDALLVPQGASVAALVTLGGVSDVAALAALAQRSRSVTLLDVKTASETLVAEQRERMLVSLSSGRLAVDRDRRRRAARPPARLARARAARTDDAGRRRRAASGRHLAEPVPPDLVDPRGRARSRLRVVLRARGRRRGRASTHVACRPRLRVVDVMGVRAARNGGHTGVARDRGAGSARRHRELRARAAPDAPARYAPRSSLSSAFAPFARYSVSTPATIRV